MLTSATEHYQRQQRITALGVMAARRAWRRRNQTALLASVVLYQRAAATDAVRSVPLMLAEQDIDAPPVAGVNANAFAGTASDGRPLGSLLEIPTTEAALSMIVATQLQDAARAAAGVSGATRPGVSGYVRMLNPPSCSRCAILAGKFYRWNDGFQRHPRCDCRHIPSSEDRAGDLTTNPDDYFHSLTAAEQDKHFTKAGAQAIRDGADISQVVNARRGMSTAGVTKTTTRVIDGETFTVNVSRRTLSTERAFGRDVAITREGVTRRGQYGRSRGGFEKQRGRKYEASRHNRLMPESIYEHAKDRDDALRLLKLHGYIF